jgi:hypothetical protein
MYAPKYNWDAVECTRQAYGLGRGRKKRYGKPDRPSMMWRSLKYHTGWLTRDEAVECIEEIPQYNRFHPDYVRYAVSFMPSSTRVVVGREGSPVLYFWTDRSYAVADILQRIDGGDGVFAASSPDELGAVRNAETYPTQTVGENPKVVPSGEWTLIRAWWD